MIKRFAVYRSHHLGGGCVRWFDSYDEAKALYNKLSWQFGRRCGHRWCTCYQIVRATVIPGQRYPLTRDVNNLPKWRPGGMPNTICRPYRLRLNREKQWPITWHTLCCLAIAGASYDDPRILAGDEAKERAEAYKQHHTLRFLKRHWCYSRIYLEKY